MAVIPVLVQFVFALVISYTDGADNQTSVSPSGVTTALTANTTAEVCMNTIPDCHYHRKEEICQGIYKPWATARCARYCGFCKDVGGTDEPCSDAIPNCEQYKPCHDPRFFVWVEDHCRKFCHHCGPTTPASEVTTHVSQSTPKLQPFGTESTTIPGTQSPGNTATTKSSSSVSEASGKCPDQLPYCTRYSKRACSNRAWALTYCPRYCNLCDSVTVAKTMPTTRGTTVTHASIVTSAATPKVSTSASTQSATTGPSPSCKDQLATCSFYSKTACDNKQWGRTYCPRYCNLCNH